MNVTQGIDIRIKTEPKIYALSFIESVHAAAARGEEYDDTIIQMPRFKERDLQASF